MFLLYSSQQQEALNLDGLVTRTTEYVPNCRVSILV